MIWEGLFSTFKKWQRRGREEGMGMACYASYIIIYLQTPEAAVSKEESCDSLFPIDQFEDIIPEFYTTDFNGISAKSPSLKSPPL